MNALDVPIAGQPLDHPVYHFVRTYSNREHVTRFRMAYARFRAGGDERHGAREYLKAVHHAAHTSEAAVDDAVRVLLASDSVWSAAAAIDRLGHHGVSVELNVPSYRLETAKGAKTPAASAADSTKAKLPGGNSNCR